MLPQQILDALIAAGQRHASSLATRVCLAQPNISRAHAYLMIVGNAYKQGDVATKATLGHAAERFTNALDPYLITAGRSTQGGGFVSLGEALGLSEADNALTA